ncbi:MAG: 6-pyruvoyl-tetrahydropterin synthase-related protein [bacterium]|nr:6-pyruvoyl-tetrahydropterin synthase-related protein [bacterium]
MVKKNLSIIVVILISIIAVLDLFNYGIPPTHDGEYHVLRFQQFYKVLSGGTLYPRWAPDFNNGFGIPLFNYVYPLPNYLAAFFHALGFGFIDAFKLNMAAASITGSIFMYLWARKYWGEWSGIVSSVFYTFSPYHFLDIYVRGSVGEVWSLGLAPGLFWAYLRFFETRKKIYFVLSTILLALLVLAHNILALIFFAFFLAYAIFLISGLKNRSRDLSSLATAVICGLGLSSPFWLPAILETEYVTGLQVFDPTQHFPALYKLIYSSWGYGFSGTNAPDQMSFQIGIANLTAVFGSIVLLFFLRNKRTLIFFISSFLVTVFLLTPFSIFIWKNFPLISYVQFPWRFLSLAILLVSLLAGSLVQDSLFKRKNRAQIILAVLLILMSIGFSVKYAKAPFYHKRDDNHYFSRPNFTDGTNSPGNAFKTVWLSSVPKKAKEKIELVAGSGNIEIKELKSTSYIFNSYLNQDSKVRINSAYFPGWSAQVDEKKVPVININGIIHLNVPKGRHVVSIKLDNTFVQKLSYVYFLISILLIIYHKSYVLSLKSK